jgi:hypothetical protein
MENKKINLLNAYKIDDSQMALTSRNAVLASMAPPDEYVN